MKRMLPDSLFGRLMSALLAAIVFSAVIVALLIERERREADFWRSDAADVVRLITRASSELAAMTPQERG